MDVAPFYAGWGCPKQEAWWGPWEPLTLPLWKPDLLRHSSLLLTSRPQTAGPQRADLRLQDLSEAAGSRSFQEAPGRKKQNALRFCQRKSKSELPAPAWDRGCVFGLGKQSHISCRTWPGVAAQAVLCYGAWIPLMKILGLRWPVNREQEGGGPMMLGDSKLFWRDGFIHR